MKQMKIRINVVVAIMITFCFTATLFTIMPIQSANKPYNPWLDFNDDGTISLADLVVLANSYGTSGTPLQKASIEYDSGWLNLTGETSQNYTLTHNLGLTSTDMMVDARRKTPIEAGYGAQLEWNMTYGGTEAYSVVQTSDGGYALAGVGGAGNGAWLVKTDANGNALWTKSYGGRGDDRAYSVVQTGDGGYVLAGWTNSSGAGNSDFWLVKTNSNGVMQWNKTYGGTEDDGAYSMVQTNDGGYALAGFTQSFGAGASDFWLVKTDASGNMLWNKTYGGTGDGRAYSVVQTSDGGYALAGETYSFGAGNSDFWLVKTDASGNMQWNKTYGGTGDDTAYSVVQTGDGGYALAGGTYSFGAGASDFWLVKTDASGNAQWNMTYGGSFTEQAYSVVQTSDGGYALAGFTQSFGAGNFDFWLVKADSNGVMQWSKTYGGASYDIAYALVQTNDGGLALAGYTMSLGAGQSGMWLVKIDSELGLAWFASTTNSITLVRDATMPWSFVRVRIYKHK